jgi:hypothetical protein
MPWGVMIGDGKNSDYGHIYEAMAKTEQNGPEGLELGQAEFDMAPS